jgi:uncharacterized delta-60 repeat protein
MSMIKAAYKKVSPLFALSRRMLALLMLSLLLWTGPVQARTTARVEDDASFLEGPQDDPKASDGQVDGINDSGPGFMGTNHYPFLTGNVLSNDTDIYEHPLMVTGFDASGAKGQVSLVNPWPDSSLDTTFGIGGKATSGIDLYNTIHAVALQADDKILAVGTSSGLIGGYSFAVARYTPDGSLDPSFNGSGWVTPRFDIGSEAASSLLVQPDGKVVVAGEASTYFGVTRINPDGSLDTSFGKDGYVTTSFGGVECAASSVALQTDHKLLVAGFTKGSGSVVNLYDFALARYNPNGSLDTSFDKDGKVTTDFVGNDRGSTVLVQSDGKIVVVGTGTAMYNPNDSHIAMARYNTNGSLDTSFGSGGKVVTSLPSLVSYDRAVLQPDGKIIVAGTNNYDNQIVVVRYNTDGNLDDSFKVDGISSIHFTSIALQTDGKVVLAGTIYTSYNWNFWLMRLNSDGSLDTTFGTGGTAVAEFLGADNTAYAFTLQKDGKILVGGKTPTVIGLYGDSFCLVRVNKDGFYQPRNTFRYDPNGQFDALLPGETVFDTFTYSVSSGVMTDTAIVTITVSVGLETHLPLIIK